jgi:hypothetical protein
MMTNETLTARSAIRTRYSGTSPSITATANGNRVRVSYNHALDDLDNHAAAAQAFLAKYNEFETELVKDALWFDNDYFWTWHVTGPKEKEWS